MAKAVTPIAAATPDMMTAFHARCRNEATSAAKPEAAAAIPSQAEYFNSANPVRKCHNPRWLPVPDARSRISAAHAVASAITCRMDRERFDLAMTSAPLAVESA